MVKHQELKRVVVVFEMIGGKSNKTPVLFHYGTGCLTVN